MIKQLFSICFALVALCCLVSCEKSDSKVEYIPFRSEEDGKWGMISTEGKVLFENEFHNVPTYVTDGRFFVQNQDGFWEMYTAEEKPERIGDEFRYATPFSDGVAMVTPRNGAISIIDTKGNVKVELKKLEGKSITQAYAFVGKIAPVMCDTLQGVVNTTGETILPPLYTDLKITQDSRIIASDYDYVSTHTFYDTIPLKGKQLIFDQNGKQMYQLDMNKYFSIVSEGVTDKYITVCKRDLVEKTEGSGKDKFTYKSPEWEYSIIDYNGKTIVGPSKQISTILAVRGDYYIYVNEDNLCGVKKIDGTDIIKPEYNGINFIGSDYLATEKNGDESNEYKSTFKLYNLQGEQVTHDVYSGIAGNRTYRAIAGKDIFVCSDEDEWNLVDEKGSKVDGLPKIFAMVPYSSGDYVLTSDEIDYPKFLKKVDITADSMGDFTFNTKPQQAIVLQQKTWGWNDDKSQSKPKPSDYTSMSTLNMYLTKDGHSYSCEVQYPSPLSTQTFTQKQVIDFVYGNRYWYHMQSVPSGYTFNNITPKWFKISFSSYNYYGHLRTLYKELVKYVKSWGTVDDSNPGATLMTLKNGHNLVVALTENEVFLKWGKLNQDDKWIGQYSSNSEKLQSTYDGNAYYLTMSNNPSTAFSFEEEGD